MRTLLTVAIALAVLAPVAEGAEPKVPPVSILLRDRHARIVPIRDGTAHSGGGNIDVQQPAPDTVVITLTGAVSAADHPCGSSALMSFDFEQMLEVVFEQPDVKGAKLAIEFRVIGLLRSGRKGTASECGASVTLGGPTAVTLTLPERTAVGGESLSINDKSGPAELAVAAGPQTLHACWQLSAAHPKALLGKSASAEFAPEPALDPLWVGGPRDPFRGAGKKDFGLQITLKVVADTPPAPKADKPAQTAANR